MEPDLRQALLRVAHEAIGAALERRNPKRDPLEDRLARLGPSGCFVSLHLDGNLRGCIGVLEGRLPLLKTVREMAEAAAFEDPRFPPVSPEEAQSLEVEISVLTVPIPAQAADVQVGRHGLLIDCGSRHGVLLPQVATERGWTAEEFLDQTCVKAGLRPGAWKQPEAELRTFEAEVFGDASHR